jgi:hypothetical protein
MTHVTRGRSYEFEVIEQNLAVGGGIRLLGGCYTLHELPGGHTRLSLKTRYVSHRRPRWLCQMIEAAVCHSFHRYIMNALRKNLQSR